MGLLTHRNDRKPFRQPERLKSNFSRRCWWARMPTLQPSLRLGGGLETHPTKNTLV
ncbi:MAG: hypothetical protein J5680_07710 [Neisseriaceae bacterium]|nr:hypothetical protein [Neisseriaceae bacterium]